MNVLLKQIPFPQVFFIILLFLQKKVKSRACTKKKIYFIYLLSTHTVCQKQKAFKNSIGHEF